jgi:hypothetical protein
LRFGIPGILFHVMLNDIYLKQKGNRVRNHKIRYRKPVSQFDCQVDDALDLHYWRKEMKIFDLAVQRVINRFPFSIYGVTNLLRRFMNHLAITKVEGNSELTRSQ